MVACRGLRSYCLALTCVLASCGAAAATETQSDTIATAVATETRSERIAASAAYSPRIGDVWTFVNAYRDTTTITTVAAPNSVACRKGKNVIWRYHKTNARAYWLPRVVGATIDFVLHQDPDRSWRSTSSVISMPQSCPWCNGATQFTWQILDNPPPIPNGYRITPPTLVRGDRVIYETVADALGGAGQYTFDCLVPVGRLVAQPGHGAQWRSEFYIEEVQTPAYSGPASVSEQWENCNAMRTNVGCGHEKWWFAPGLGLVKVWQINSGSGVEGDEDPRLIMVRVR